MSLSTIANCSTYRIGKVAKYLTDARRYLPVPWPSRVSLFSCLRRQMLPLCGLITRRPPERHQEAVNWEIRSFPGCRSNQENS